jgi:hypothetical protein
MMPGISLPLLPAALRAADMLKIGPLGAQPTTKTPHPDTLAAPCGESGNAMGSRGH